MNYIQFLEQLEDSGLAYAIVGGMALALHGAVRGTIDLDLCMALDEKSLSKAENFFKENHFVSRIPVNAKEIFQFREEYIAKKNLIAWSFYHRHKPSFVVDVLLIEDVKRIKIVKMKAYGIHIAVASIDDLIRMKTKSGRPQDVEDVKALRELKKK